MRLIARLVDEELNLEALRLTYAGRGSRPHRPDLLLKVLIYEHFKARIQPTQWFMDLHENIAVQWLVFGIKPSLTTLYEFRDRVQPLLEDLNRQVVQAAIEEGHTDGSCGALDGTTVAANATRHRMVNLETVEKRLEILGRQIAQVDQPTAVAAAIEVPHSEASPASPETPLQTPTWTAKTLRGMRRQRDHLRRAREVLQAKNAVNTRRRKDKRKQGGKICVALGDPVAPFGLDKLKTYRPLYNVQTMSDLETALVLSYATTPTTADNGLLLPMIEKTVAMTARPLRQVLVDSGYPSGEDLASCQEKGVAVYAPWNENSFTESKRAKRGKEVQIPKDQFVFDPTGPSYRCPEGKTLSYRERSSKQKADGTYFAIEIYQANSSDCGGCPLQSRCLRGRSGARTVRRQEHEELIEGLKKRMKESEAKKLYRKRGCTVELRFADFKTHKGLQRFSGRTPERADAQVGLTVLAHNLRTLEKLRISRLPPNSPENNAA